MGVFYFLSAHRCILPKAFFFRFLSQSQKSLFIFTVMHRQKNIGFVNLVPTSCVLGGRCPSVCDLCVRGLTPRPFSPHPFGWEGGREGGGRALLLPLLLKANILQLRQHGEQARPVPAPPCRGLKPSHESGFVAPVPVSLGNFKVERKSRAQTAFCDVCPFKLLYRVTQHLQGGSERPEVGVCLCERESGTVRSHVAFESSRFENLPQ